MEQGQATPEEVAAIVDILMPEQTEEQKKPAPDTDIEEILKLIM